MKFLEEKTQSFIVRVWVEPREKEDAPPEWRGMIEHVASGERLYLKNLNEITFFIVPHLKKMGITINNSKKSKKWQNLCKLE